MREVYDDLSGSEVLKKKSITCIQNSEIDRETMQKDLTNYQRHSTDEGSQESEEDDDEK
jgi:hypothetical protein